MPKTTSITFDADDDCVRMLNKLLIKSIKANRGMSISRADVIRKAVFNSYLLTFFPEQILTPSAHAIIDDHRAKELLASRK